MRALTARQEGFAVAVAQGSTKADAYRKHYKTDGWSNEAVAQAASRTAALPHISATIMKMTEAKRGQAEGEFSITVRKLLQTFIEIAFTDPNELTSIVSGACRHCYGLGGAYQWKEPEYLEAMARWEKEAAKAAASERPAPEMPDGSGGFGYRFTAAPNPECFKCEGEGVERYRVRDTTRLSPGAKHLYRGVQPTQGGYKVLFADKDKALDSIGRMLGAFDDRLRVDLRGEVASLHLTTSDPQEAASAYERLLTARSS